MCTGGHACSGGSLDATTFLFSEMAEQPVPFPTVMELLGISEEQAKREGPGVRASRAQFDNAIAQAIDDDDTVEQYVKAPPAHSARPAPATPAPERGAAAHAPLRAAQVFDSRIARLKHAVKVKGELTGPTKEFHERIGGDIQKAQPAPPRPAPLQIGRNSLRIGRNFLRTGRGPRPSPRRRRCRGRADGRARARWAD